MWRQHNDHVVCVPQHISKIGVFTGQIWLIVAIAAYISQIHSLIPFAITLWATTIMHWLKVQYNGIIKALDIIVVILSILYVSFYASHRFTLNHRDWWFYTCFFVLFVYVVNCIVFYFQTSEDPHSQDHINSQLLAESFTYKYFSFDFVPPFTENRENCYYVTTIVHTAALHLFIGGCLIYFIINSPPKPI